MIFEFLESTRRFAPSAPVCGVRNATRDKSVKLGKEFTIKGQISRAVLARRSAVRFLDSPRPDQQTVKVSSRSWQPFRFRSRANVRRHVESASTRTQTDADMAGRAEVPKKLRISKTARAAGTIQEFSESTRPSASSASFAGVRNDAEARFYGTSKDGPPIATARFRTIFKVT